eukprot:352000-Chlamydomonas_euryale.AAC.2
MGAAICTWMVMLMAGAQDTNSSTRCVAAAPAKLAEGMHGNCITQLHEDPVCKHARGAKLVRVGPASASDPDSPACWSLATEEGSMMAVIDAQPAANPARGSEA